jgi:8-oxo-dGTP pyrophosphatase MutT (NUDIX family)
MRTIKRDIAGALLLSNDAHVLVGKNGKGGVDEGLWVIPAGGIDAGESKEDAAKREILEEVGIDTGERVLIDMTFYNFKVTIDLPAQNIPITPQDDFAYAE